MAFLPVSVPAYWPDFKVTSHKRATGSHSTGNALDITLDLANASREKGAKYWFFYFLTIEMLWLVQRRGRVRAAIPPQCPHFHLETGSEKPFIGMELVRFDKKTGQCVAENVYQVPKTETALSNQFVDDFNAKFAEPYTGLTVERIKASWEYLTTPNTKQIYVNPNGQIGENDLKDRFSMLFGDGSTSQVIADMASQVLNYDNSTALKEAVQPWVGLALVAAIAGGAYWIAREQRYWQDPATPPKI